MLEHVSESLWGRPRLRRRSLGALVAAVAIAGAALWLKDRSQPSHRPGRAAMELDESFDEEALPGNPGYVGWDACAACHAARVSQFQATNHFRACRVPRAGDMPAGFARGGGTFTTRHPPLRFERRDGGDTIFQTTIHCRASEAHRTP